MDFFVSSYADVAVTFLRLDSSQFLFPPFSAFLGHALPQILVCEHDREHEEIAVIVGGFVLDQFGEGAIKRQRAAFEEISLFRTRDQSSAGPGIARSAVLPFGVKERVNDSPVGRLKMVKVIRNAVDDTEVILALQSGWCDLSRGEPAPGGRDHVLQREGRQWFFNREARKPGQEKGSEKRLGTKFSYHSKRQQFRSILQV